MVTASGQRSAWRGSVSPTSVSHHGHAVIILFYLRLGLSRSAAGTVFFFVLPSCPAAGQMLWAASICSDQR